MAVGRYLAVFACILVFVGIGFGQAVSNENEPTVEDDEQTAIEEGMEPLYDMTTNFLDVLQPESKGYILEILGIDGTYYENRLKPTRQHCAVCSLHDS